MYACVCQGITEADVRRLGAAGIAAPEDLITVLSLKDDDCCGRCVKAIESFVALAEEGAAAPAPVAASAPGTRRRAMSADVAAPPVGVAVAALAAAGTRAFGQGIR